MCEVRLSWFGISTPFIDERKCKSSWLSIHAFILTSFPPAPQNSTPLSLSGHRWKTIWPAVHPRTSSNWPPVSGLHSDERGNHHRDYGHASMDRICRGIVNKCDIYFSRLNSSTSQGVSSKKVSLKLHPLFSCPVSPQLAEQVTRTACLDG